MDKKYGYSIVGKDINAKSLGTSNKIEKGMELIYSEEDKGFLANGFHIAMTKEDADDWLARVSQFFNPDDHYVLYVSFDSTDGTFDEEYNEYNDVSKIEVVEVIRNCK